MAFRKNSASLGTPLVKPLGHRFANGESSGKGIRWVWRGRLNRTMSPERVSIEARMTVSVRAPSSSALA